jgi:hypothetical protein
MESATLHADDVETWAELQVEALRHLATMQGPWSNALDWENVIEEIESLGSEQRGAVESSLESALAHALKVIADPGSLSAEHWTREIGSFLKQARNKMKPAMRSRIDMQVIWQDACAEASNALEAFDLALPEVPARSPFSFDDVADPEFDPLGDLRLLVLQRAPNE